MTVETRGSGEPDWLGPISMGDASGRTMTTAVSPPRHTKKWHVPVGRWWERPRAALPSGIIGACFASPEPDRNMVKSSVTIG
ncbi:MAG TPA: hypothetical protein VMU94_23260, partial [Streptosporangiaceae bacterium]|nr:hypothetical protein [Streptosporangiaceae bacterium]